MKVLSVLDGYKGSFTWYICLQSEHTRHDFVTSIFSNIESTIGVIEKVWAHLHTGAYK